MTLSSFIKLNSREYLIKQKEKFQEDIKNQVMQKIIKLRSTNCIDEQTVIVLQPDNREKHHASQHAYYLRNKQKIHKRHHAYYIKNKERLLNDAHNYYLINRDSLLQQKKLYNQKPEVKKHRTEYSRKYYLLHKEEMNRKHREYLKRKNNN